MLKKTALALVFTLVFNTLAFAGLGSKEAAYVGGTVAGFVNEKEPVVGHLDFSNNDEVKFVPKDKKRSRQTFSIA